MHFRQFYLGCLAHASYIIGDAGEAAIVDPQRDVDQYLKEAADHGLAIRWIIETHIHADFVSGHKELAERTGATICVGPGVTPDYPHRTLADGDTIAMGETELKALHTPGHTPEHISILVTAPGEPQRVLTGDTLFVGDVGRPDLVAARGHTATEMAGLLYDSLQNKLMTLPDDVVLFPGHGQGSLCGRYLSDATSSTIGEQRRTNFMLQPMSREAFIQKAIADQPENPDYFLHDVKMNLSGAPALGSLDVPPALAPDAFAARADDDAWVLDTRDAFDYADGHIPGALNIGLDGRFAVWAGALVPPDQPVLIVATGEQKMREAVTRLARIGLHNAAGWLEGGMTAWQAAAREVVTTPMLLADELEEQLGQVQILDVRRETEFAAGHIAGSVNLPLDRLPDAGTAGLDPGKPVVVVCSTAHRASAAISLLERAGVEGASNLNGGTEAWEAFDLELVRPTASNA